MADDLGSAVEVGAPVHSTTQWLSQETLIGQPAKARSDWYMLAVALAAEVHKVDWKEKLIENSHCPASKVVAVQGRNVTTSSCNAFIWADCSMCVPLVTLQVVFLWRVTCTEVSQAAKHNTFQLQPEPAVSG